jgi:Ca-activated chloride channel family protein
VLEQIHAFHFAQPLWLVALVTPLLLWRVPPSPRGGAADPQLFGRYADRELLPHLVRIGLGTGRRRRRLGLWSAVWALGVLALAGPRWDYTDVRLRQTGDSLVVLLDLSASMRATDVRPSRLARARQEVEDLLDRNPGLRVGLVAFGSVARVITPVTEDEETVRHLLPSLTPDLMRWQGSRLSAGLERAQRLLAGQPPGSRHAVVLVSDGDFPEADLEERVKALKESGITLHVLGMGSAEGAPVPTAAGAPLGGRDGRPVLSALDEPRLKALAEAGGGVYRRADYHDRDTGDLVREVLRVGRSEVARDHVRRVWGEQYHLLVLIMAGLVVWGMRRARARRGSDSGDLASG